MDQLPQDDLRAKVAQLLPDQQREAYLNHCLEMQQHKGDEIFLLFEACAWLALIGQAIPSRIDAQISQIREIVSILGEREMAAKKSADLIRKAHWEGGRELQESLLDAVSETSQTADLIIEQRNLIKAELLKVKAAGEVMASIQKAMKETDSINRKNWIRDSALYVGLPALALGIIVGFSTQYFFHL